MFQAVKRSNKRKEDPYGRENRRLCQNRRRAGRLLQRHRQVLCGFWNCRGQGRRIRQTLPPVVGRRLRPAQAVCQGPDYDAVGSGHHLVYIELCHGIRAEILHPRHGAGRAGVQHRHHAVGVERLRQLLYDLAVLAVQLCGLGSCPDCVDAQRGQRLSAAAAGTAGTSR